MTNDEIREALEEHIPAYWGRYLDVPDSWLPHLWELHEKLMVIEPDYEVHQVKEKFGGLRFYLGDNNSARAQPLMQQIVDEYEAASYSWKEEKSNG